MVFEMQRGRRTGSVFAWGCGVATVLAGTLAAIVVAAPPTHSITWVTDLSDSSGAPVGMLLSDNEGYWGESVLTGVTYHYEAEPNNPQDRIANQAGTFGRRLLDGRIAGNWHVPVGQSRGPLVVVFDFKRPCDFSEVTLFSTRSRVISVRIETADDAQGPWREVHHQSLDQAAEKELKRVRWEEPVPGRFLRLAVDSSDITRLDEVLVWGTAEVSEAYPQRIAATYTLDSLHDQWESIPGIVATRFDAAQFQGWRHSLGHHAERPAVWAITSEPSPMAPVLPDAMALPLEARLEMARNETESVYVTLTNTSLAERRHLTLREVVWKRADDAVVEPRIQTTLRVGGALPAKPPQQRLSAEQRLRLHEDDSLGEEVGFSGNVQILPFFAPGEALGRSLMQRYLTNGLQIVDFPRLSLPAGGSAVFMVQLTTDRPEPGVYRGHLVAVTEEGVEITLPLQLRVANLELPEVDLWVRSWGNGTGQFPFESQRRRENDVKVNRDLGVTVWPGFPEAGSKAELFGKLGRTYHRRSGIPSRFVHLGHGNRIQVADLTESDRQDVVDHVRALVREAEELGLAYDQWWVELWDEPQEGNAALFGELARLIRQTDAQVKIYMNPLFWRPGHASPQVVVEHLGPYYNELVDISVPISTLVRDGAVSTEQLWTQPRFVNALFLHPAGRAGRGMAWRAFELGFNGWGYYCYYAPRGNPWDIRTWRGLNYRYQMVFPGPEGPILTPLYETMRDGWEDYRLLAALREQSKEALLARLLQGWKDGTPLEELRIEALGAF